MEQLPCFSSVDVAQAAIGLAKLGFRDKDTMQALVQRARKLQSVMEPRHARAINRGLSLCGMPRVHFAVNCAEQADQGAEEGGREWLKDILSNRD